MIALPWTAEGHTPAKVRGMRMELGKGEQPATAALQPRCLRPRLRRPRRPRPLSWAAPAAASGLLPRRTDRRLHLWGVPQFTHLGIRLSGQARPCPARIGSPQFYPTWIGRMPRIGRHALRPPPAAAPEILPLWIPPLRQGAAGRGTAVAAPHWKDPSRLAF